MKCVSEALCSAVNPAGLSIVLSVFIRFLSDGCLWVNFVH